MGRSGFRVDAFPASRGAHGPVARLVELGLLDEATPLLRSLGWDGSTIEGPEDPGARHQDAFTDRERHLNGIHYTPTAVAQGLVRVALADIARDSRVGDPACGAGAFLLAAAEHLRTLGAPVARIVREQLFGADIDATAVALTRLELT